MSEVPYALFIKIFFWDIKTPRKPQPINENKINKIYFTFRNSSNIISSYGSYGGPVWGEVEPRERASRPYGLRAPLPPTYGPP